MHARERFLAERAEMAPDPFTEMQFYPAGDMGHAARTYARYVKVACKIMSPVVANEQVGADAPDSKAASWKYRIQLC